MSGCDGFFFSDFRMVLAVDVSSFLSWKIAVKKRVRISCRDSKAMTEERQSNQDKDQSQHVFGRDGDVVAGLFSVTYTRIHGHSGGGQQQSSECTPRRESGDVLDDA